MQDLFVSSLNRIEARPFLVVELAQFPGKLVEIKSACSGLFIKPEHALLCAYLTEKYDAA